MSQPTSSNQASRRRAGGVVVPKAPKFHQRAGAALLYAFLRALNWTLRFSYELPPGFLDGAASGPMIYCIWHNRLAVAVPIYFSYARPRNPTSGLAALVSASRDGAFLAAILECFSVQPVRGSSSRRGPQALLELTTWAERGFDLAITPDGPRGPRYVVQEGVLALAQITGLPIVPVCCHISPKIQMRSWDRFQLPIPGASCRVKVGNLVRIPRGISDTERESLRAQLQASLQAITVD